MSWPRLAEQAAVLGCGQMGGWPICSGWRAAEARLAWVWPQFGSHCREQSGVLWRVCFVRKWEHKLRFENLSGESLRRQIGLVSGRGVCFGLHEMNEEENLQSCEQNKAALCLPL